MGTRKPTPMDLYVREGLPDIARRIGTAPAFTAAMLRSLRSTHRPGLAGFRTKSDEDWTIAFLDAWAGVLETLTFYSERIGNESYLGTATEAFSMQELAALVGYTMSPATAAEVHLAFVADDTVLTTGVAELAVPLGVKSVPEQGELPQTFETVEPLRLKAAWNLIRPLQTWPQVLGAVASGCYIGATAPVPPIGARLVLLDAGGVPQASDGSLIRRLRGVVPGPVGFQWLALVTGAAPGAMPALAAAMLPLAPANATLRRSTPAAFRADLLASRWPRSTVLDGADFQAIPLTEVEASLVAAPRGASSLRPVHLRDVARIFGHSVVAERSDGTIKPRPSTLLAAVAALKPTDTTQDATATHMTLFLDRAYDAITPGMLLVMRGRAAGTASVTECWTTATEVDTASIEAFGISGEVTRLRVPRNWNGEVIDSFDLRQVTIATNPLALTLPALPLSETVGGATLILDRADPDIATGQVLIVTGERADLAGVVQSERATVADVMLNGTTLQVLLALPLQQSYTRASVKIAGNVARATHGETQLETLGSGDARQRFQSFTLKGAPLTYLSADTPTGRAAALEVRVDGVRWTEVASFDDTGPEDRIYRVQTRVDGKTRITFGDGTTGARLPTGDANVACTYRKGAGAQGRVRAGQASLLVSKPRSLRSVTNPLPATGGSEGEALADARRNVPQKMLTLGRVVSLRDAEDFARSFAGVTKTKAAWSWTGGAQEITLTVAGEDEAPLPTDTGVLPNLGATLRAVSAPGTSIMLRCARIARFTLRARLRIDPAYLAADGTADATLTLAQTTLRGAFAFASRDIGQPVRASDILLLLQGVPGVVAVDLDQLYRTDGPPASAALLRADVPRSGVQGTMLGAEILLLSADPIVLEVF